MNALLALEIGSRLGAGFATALLLPAGIATGFEKKGLKSGDPMPITG